LGTGINLIFPPENAELFERIAASGAVITQFRSTVGGQTKFSDPHRIVAGMTWNGRRRGQHDEWRAHHGEHGGGSGRQVSPCRGGLIHRAAKGCHDLIKKGAKLCEGVEDILSEFEYLFPASNRPASPGETGICPRWN